MNAFELANMAFTEWHVEALSTRKREVLAATNISSEALRILERRYLEEDIGSVRKSALSQTRGLVYFIQESGIGAIKIGTSENPQRRLRALSGDTPHNLVLLATMSGDYRIETLLHRFFHHARIRGEWFRPIPELLQYIDGCR